MLRDNVAGYSGSRAGTRMWALITARLPAAMAALARDQVAFRQHRGVHVDERHGVVRVDARVAVAREVLGAGGHARRLHAGDVGGGVPGDQVGAGAEGAHADDRVVGVGVDVGGRGPVEVDAAGGEPAAQFRGHLPGEPDVVHRTEGEVAGEGGTGAHLEPG